MRHLIHPLNLPQLHPLLLARALLPYAHRVLHCVPLHLILHQSILIHLFTILHINVVSLLDNFSRFMPQKLQKYPDSQSRVIQDFGLQSKPLHTSSILPKQ